MEPTYTFEVIRFWSLIGVACGWIGGYLWAVFLLRKSFLKIHKLYIDEIHNQYKYLLNKFGIYKKPNGEWQSHAGETISSGKEVKAYQRCNTESEE
jgi:hypothetical protein